MEPTDVQQDSVSQALKITPAACPEPSEPAAVDTEHPLVARLTKGLEDCDWDQLHERYVNAMDEHSRMEEDLRAETAKLLEVHRTTGLWCDATLTSGSLDFHSMVSNHHFAG